MNKIKANISFRVDASKETRERNEKRFFAFSQDKASEYREYEVKIGQVNLVGPRVQELIGDWGWEGISRIMSALNETCHLLPMFGEIHIDFPNGSHARLQKEADMEFRVFYDK